MSISTNYNTNTPKTTCKCGCSCSSAGSASSACCASSASSAGSTKMGSAQGSFDMFQGFYDKSSGEFYDENGNLIDAQDTMDDISAYMKKNGIKDAGKTKADNAVKAAQDKMNDIKNDWDDCSKKQNEYKRLADAARRNGDMDSYDRYMALYNQCENDIRVYEQNYESAMNIYDDAKQSQQDYYGTLYEKYGENL